jgi:hypothetical protein
MNNSSAKCSQHKKAQVYNRFRTSPSFAPAPDLARDQPDIIVAITKHRILLLGFNLKFGQTRF